MRARLRCAAALLRSSSLFIAAYPTVPLKRLMPKSRPTQNQTALEEKPSPSTVNDSAFIPSRMQLLYRRFLRLLWAGASSNELLALRAQPGSLERHANTNEAMAMATIIPADNHQKKAKTRPKAPRDGVWPLVRKGARSGGIVEVEVLCSQRDCYEVDHRLVTHPFSTSSSNTGIEPGMPEARTGHVQNLRNAEASAFVEGDFRFGLLKASSSSLACMLSSMVPAPRHKAKGD
ncbi:hypothetical protein B0H13DRAFT_1911093 [Mycena leptocephala]|nr:hypothetical protein B0H13DRAFT_1911093 [Mycena leptocephala]